MSDDFTAVNADDLARAYRSPFARPDLSRCTSPEDHRNYPDRHRVAGDVGVDRYLWGGRCPVHHHRVAATGHDLWYQHREAYATGDTETARADALAQMLACVTVDNPPDAPPEKKRRRTTARECPPTGVVTFSVVLVVCLLIVLAAALGA